MPDSQQRWLVQVSDSEDSDEARLIHQALRTEVEAEVGPSGRKALCLALRDETGALRGGLRGFSHWKWLYISHLWVEESFRAEGLGAKLIARAEEEARARGCIGVYVDTFSLKAARFYEKSGFSEVGRIADFPPGQQRIFLNKSL